MAFDAGMLACTLSEIRRASLGARVEKVFQPEKDEIVLQIRSLEGGRRLLINAGSNSPRIGFTGTAKENPMVPPMLCMLLRKHLQGAKLTAVTQAGFERVALLEFETRDEMGFTCNRYLIAELMGKYSNLIFTDGNKKVLAALRTVDFTTSGLRQVLPGMIYELPPKQEKINPLEVSEADFALRFAESDGQGRADRWIADRFLGISSAVAREIVFRACGDETAKLDDVPEERMQASFFGLMRSVAEEDFSPCMILNEGKPAEYAFCRLSHYSSPALCKDYHSAGELLDEFFGSRDREQHIRQRSGDILHIITSAQNRIRKKLSLQREELSECEKGETYKKEADLITANLYCLSQGMARAELTDYEKQSEDGSFGTCVVQLDPRLSPAANAQRLYKRYNKAKNAKTELTKQIGIGEEELVYLESVQDSLSHAETAADLGEIREELFRSGYASKMKHYVAPKKSCVPAVAKFVTSNGLTVLCGKNNLQNEYITHKLAEKSDYWFHVKGQAGSHVVLVCNGEEPAETDFTEAAEIAAFFSKAAGAPHTEVDYTLAKNVKKPAGGKPGLVIYHTNWSCVVSPSEEEINKRKK